MIRDNHLHVFVFSIEANPSTPKLLTWSSEHENRIKIIDLETKQEFAKFIGVNLKKEHGIFQLSSISQTCFISATMLLI